MLDSVSEEDDAVQETWLRLSRTDSSSAENLDGWLTKVVGLPAEHLPAIDIAGHGSRR